MYTIQNLRAGVASMLCLLPFFPAHSIHFEQQTDPPGLAIRGSYNRAGKEYQSGDVGLTLTLICSKPDKIMGICQISMREAHVVLSCIEKQNLQASVQNKQDQRPIYCLKYCMKHISSSLI